MYQHSFLSTITLDGSGSGYLVTGIYLMLQRRYHRDQITTTRNMSRLHQSNGLSILARYTSVPPSFPKRLLEPVQDSARVALTVPALVAVSVLQSTNHFPVTSVFKQLLELSGIEIADWHLHFSCRLFGNRKFTGVLVGSAKEHAGVRLRFRYR
jgi:hypothetical protein